MDCRTAQTLLELARPSATELLAEDAQVLQAHLSSCSSCATLHQTEHAINDRIGKSMRAVEIPQGLRERLLTRLDAQAGGPRIRLRRAAVLAAAAVLLMTGFLGLYWHLTYRSKVSQQAWLNEYQERFTNPGPEQVEAWFQKVHGIYVVAPPRFDYGYLNDYDFADFQGHRVPHLGFKRGSERADVYVLSGDSFDLKDQIAQTPPAGSIFTIKFELNPTNPKIGYLIIYNGSSLDPFLLPTQPDQNGNNPVG